MSHGCQKPSPILSLGGKGTAAKLRDAYRAFHKVNAAAGAGAPWGR